MHIYLQERRKMGTTQPLLLPPLLSILLLLLLLLLLVSPSLISAASFTCSGPTRSCTSMLGYKSPNATTYSSIQTLFTLPSLSPLLAANNLSSATQPPSHHRVPEGAIVRVPFPCSCSAASGNGTSYKLPVYTVQPGDGLDHIARDVYGLFVTYQEIADANNIQNPNVILTGQNLEIPLPCSCDEVGGEEVLHYAYKVEGGDTIESIAQEFGVEADTLMNLNGIKDSTSLKEEQILDVPLLKGDSPALAPGVEGGYSSATNRLTGLVDLCLVDLFVLGSIALYSNGYL